MVGLQYYFRCRSDSCTFLALLSLEHLKSQEIYGDSWMVCFSLYWCFLSYGTSKRVLGEDVDIAVFACRPVCFNTWILRSNVELWNRIQTSGEVRPSADCSLRLWD